MSDRELITNFRKHRDAVSLAGVLSEYHSLVRTTAAAQIEDPEQVESIVSAVFRVLAVHRRRLKPKTFLPAWLVRTTTYAVEKHQQETQPPKKKANGNALCLQALNRLPVRLSETLIARAWFAPEPELAADTLRLSPARLERRTRRAQKKHAKQLRKIQKSEKRCQFYWTGQVRF